MGRDRPGLRPERGASGDSGERIETRAHPPGEDHSHLFGRTLREVNDTVSREGGKCGQSQLLAARTAPPDEAIQPLQAQALPHLRSALHVAGQNIESYLADPTRRRSRSPADSWRATALAWATRDRPEARSPAWIAAATFELDSKKPSRVPAICTPGKRPLQGGGCALGSIAASDERRAANRPREERAASAPMRSTPVTRSRSGPPRRREAPSKLIVSQTARTAPSSAARKVGLRRASMTISVPRVTTSEGVEPCESATMRSTAASRPIASTRQPRMRIDSTYTAAAAVR